MADTDAPTSPAGKPLLLRSRWRAALIGAVPVLAITVLVVYVAVARSGEQPPAAAQSVTSSDSETGTPAVEVGPMPHPAEYEFLSDIDHEWAVSEVFDIAAVVEATLAHRGTPTEILTYLHDTNRVSATGYELLADHPNTPPEILDRIVRRPHSGITWQTVANAIHNPHISADTLDYIVLDSDDGRLLYEVLDAPLAPPNLSPEALTFMSELSERAQQIAVSHKNTPFPVIVSLATRCGTSWTVWDGANKELRSRQLRQPPP